MDNNKNGEAGKPFIEEAAGHFAVKILYPYPEPEPAAFANHMLVQHDRNNFFVSFYQIVPPPVLSDPAELRQVLEKNEGISAKCVARVAISREQMGAVVSALAENLAKFQSKFEQSQGEVEDTDTKAS